MSYKLEDNKTEESLNKLTGKLAKSDFELARVIEDLIDILIYKGAIQFTDLPQEAQQKIIKRQGLRKKFQGLDFSLKDDEELLL